MKLQKKLKGRKPFSRAGILLLALITFASACGDSKEYMEEDESSTLADSSETSSVVSDVGEDDTSSEESEPEIGEGEEDGDVREEERGESWSDEWKHDRREGR